MNTPCNMVQKSQMQLRKTIQKTKIFFHKTLQNLTTFLFGGYQKLPKARIINNIFCGSNSNQKFLDSDDFYGVFSGLWETRFDDVRERNDNGVSQNVQTEEDGERCRSITDIAQQIDGKITREERNKEENRTAKREEGRRGELSSQSLAKRLKQLEMMDVNNVDHALDIEEVIHYYSRLTCPVYVDIVDKFFMDMCNEYLPPQRTLSANGSMRRNSSTRSLGSVKL